MKNIEKSVNSVEKSGSGKRMSIIKLRYKVVGSVPV